MGNNSNSNTELSYFQLHRPKEFNKTSIRFIINYNGDIENNQYFNYGLNINEFFVQYFNKKFESIPFYDMLSILEPIFNLFSKSGSWFKEYFNKMLNLKTIYRFKDIEDEILPFCKKTLLRHKKLLD